LPDPAIRSRKQSHIELCKQKGGGSARWPSIARLECSQCGASANAACNCGAPYVRASARAAEAVAKTPDKSDRAIADEISVSNQTVKRARSKTNVTNVTVVKRRKGKDGKSHRSDRHQARTLIAGIENEIFQLSATANNS
jgi:hypothetical protein